MLYEHRHFQVIPDLLLQPLSEVSCYRSNPRSKLLSDEDQPADWTTVVSKKHKRGHRLPPQDTAPSGAASRSITNESVSSKSRNLASRSGPAIAGFSKTDGFAPNEVADGDKQGSTGSLRRLAVANEPRSSQLPSRLQVPAYKERSGVRVSRSRPPRGRLLRRRAHEGSPPGSARRSGSGQETDSRGSGAAET